MVIENKKSKTPLGIIRPLRRSLHMCLESDVKQVLLICYCAYLLPVIHIQLQMTETALIPSARFFFLDLTRMTKIQRENNSKVFDRHQLLNIFKMFYALRKKYALCMN